MNRDAALGDAAPVSFWLDDPAAPPSGAPLVGETTAELTVVGGGYTGLWTALLAKEADPDRDVVLLEADRCGWAASGRNGGFCAASLTHGLGNGIERFPGEVDTLERLGRKTSTPSRRRSTGGPSTVASSAPANCRSPPSPTRWRTWPRRPSRAADRPAPQLSRSGRDAGRGALAHLPGRPLGPDGVRSGQSGPTGLGAPASLRGRRGQDLRAHAGARAGVRARRSRVATVHHRPRKVRTSTVALATNAYPSLVRRLRKYVVPVYDYVLMTEPLSAGERASIGWARRQGLGDVGKPVPLLPADRRQPDPVRRLRRRLPLRATDCDRHSSSAGRPS